MTNDTPDFKPLPLAYGVWIPGKGWLKFGTRYFADHRLEMAQAALTMYDAGTGTGARIEYFDESMQAFEQLFLEREAEGERQTIARKERRPYRRFMRWVYGILRHVGKSR